MKPFKTICRFLAKDLFVFQSKLFFSSFSLLFLHCYQVLSHSANKVSKAFISCYNSLVKSTLAAPIFSNNVPQPYNFQYSGNQLTFLVTDLRDVTVVHVNCVVGIFVCSLFLSEWMTNGLWRCDKARVNTKREVGGPACTLFVRFELPNQMERVCERDTE